MPQSKKVDSDSLNVGEEKLAGVGRASELTWLRLAPLMTVGKAGHFDALGAIGPPSRS
jgi:hypothetical protein